LSPDSDVDEALIPEEGLGNKVVTKDYDLADPQGQYAIRQLGETTLELPVKGLSLRDLLAQLPNNQVKVYIDHRASKGDAEGIFFAQVKKVLPPTADIG
jgi:hypothetical protein